jgi:hypothetical protein
MAFVTTLLLDILDGAPSWTIGLVYVGALRIAAYAVLGALVWWAMPDTQSLERANRRVDELPRDMGVEERAAAQISIYEEEGVSRAGCIKNVLYVLLTILSLSALSIWLIVELWLLLESSHNPDPELGRRSIVSMLPLSGLWLVTAVIDMMITVRAEPASERATTMERYPIFLGAGFVLYATLFYFAPRGLHIYWAVVIIGGVVSGWLWRRFGPHDGRLSRISTLFL